MSYDLYWLETLDNPLNETYIDDNLNITFNLLDMFNWAFDCEYWYDKINNKKGNQILYDCLNAVNRMLLYKEKAEEFDSPNGWGKYKDALEFLCYLTIQASKYENLYLNIDK